MTRPLARFALSLCSLVCLPVAANSASAEPVTTTAGPTIQASAALPATERRPLATVIDEYVRLARGSNLGLQAATLEVERSQAALDAARGRFFPEATLGARYTRSEGGREVSLPLAAAFNPVYSTLNELLLADGKPARFGSISDPRFLLQREQEQDTRISVRQALYAPALPAALRAQRSLLEANEFARVALSQRLQRDVTIGYLDWLRASRGAVIVEASETLLAENLRITESLFRNGKVTQDQVLRAKAEWLAVGQQATETRNVREQLQSYVNFLLNRALDTDLEDADADSCGQIQTPRLTPHRDS
jgi:outer membrane protein TolC